MRSWLARNRQLSAGLLDAGLASLATFIAGLTGVRLLSESDVGVYGVFFTAFILGSVLASELIYVPAEVVAVGQPLEKRLAGLRRTIALAVGPSLLASTTALVAAFLRQSSTTGPVLFALTATTTATIFISVMQDHVRRLLHIAEQSWRAAVVSFVQLVGVAIAIPVLLVAGVDHAWVPFGSLFIANVTSTAVGVLLAGGHRPPQTEPELSFWTLVSSGKWLVVRAATPSAAAFIAANMITALAGPVAYGYAEAARQVAQPVTVLAVGIAAVLGPRAVRAGMEVDPVAAHRARIEFGALIALGAAAYVAIAGFEWALNPMSRLVPKAYAIPWLVTATVVANAIAAAVTLPSRELLGAGRSRLLASLTAISSPALLIAAATAGVTEAFARPIGFIAEGLLAVIAANWWLRRHYAQQPERKRPTVG